MSVVVRIHTGDDGWTVDAYTRNNVGEYYQHQRAVPVFPRTREILEQPPKRGLNKFCWSACI